MERESQSCSNLPWNARTTISSQEPDPRWSLTRHFVCQLIIIMQRNLLAEPNCRWCLVRYFASIDHHTGLEVPFAERGDQIKPSHSLLLRRSANFVVITHRPSKAKSPRPAVILRMEHIPKPYSGAHPTPFGRADRLYFRIASAKQPQGASLLPLQG